MNASVDTSNGIRDWAPEVYFRHTEWVSRSQLYKLAESIAVFLHSEPSTERFRGEALSHRPAAFGKVVHRAVLERGLYLFAVIPWAKVAKRNGDVGDDFDGPVPEAGDDIDPPLELPPEKLSVAAKKEAAAEKKRIAAAKKAAAAKRRAAKEEQAAAKAELLELADEHDLWLVPPDDLDRCDAVVESIWSNPKAAAYLRGEAIVGGQACIAVYSEVAITWIDDATGVPCRALLDRVLVYPHCVVVIDLKTYRDTPSPERWADAAVYDWLYEQAEFYCRGAREAWGKPALFVWVVARNDEPYQCTIDAPRTEELAVAKRTNDALLWRLAKLMEDDQWVDGWTTKINKVEPSRRGVAILAARAEAMEAAIVEST